MQFIKQLFKYGLLPIIIFILIFSFSYFLGDVLRFYITTFATFSLFAFWTLLYSYKFLFVNKKDDSTLYGWLDKLNGDTRFLKEVFKSEGDNFNLIKNLESVYSNLNTIVEGDIKKLKLLKAYFRAKNTENSLDSFGKVLITLILAISAGLINSGKFFNILVPKDKTGIIDVEFFQMLGSIYLFALLMLVIVAIILETNQHKKRNKFIEEMIEVSINEKTP